MTEPAPSATRSPWFRLLWIVPAAIVLLAIVVFVAKGVRTTDGFASFLAAYPGQSELPAGAPVGFPAWVSWQHGLNAFFMLFILRTGWRLHLAQRPDAFWTRKNDGRIRTTGAPVRIGIDLWLHIVIDTLWVLNGVVYYVLIFATGQWTRIVPVHWDVIPNALSAGVQYASLDWPAETSWTNYNALQLLSYFAVVFLAAPLALITGIRMSPGFAARFRGLDRIFPTRIAKRIHYWTMVFFAGFVVVHVTLVLTTGALNNLNYMYAARYASDWVGFSIFAASIVLMVVVWFGVRPALIERLAGLGGTVRRMPPRR